MTEVVQASPIDQQSREKSPRRKRYGSLDALRGIAALLIVLRHTPLFFSNMQGHESYLAVDLFFVLSGFVLCEAYDQKLTLIGGRRFTALRFVRLYPMYVLGLCIGILAEVLAYHVGVNWVPPHSWKRAIVAGLLMIPVLLPARTEYPFNSPSWTLLLELLVNAAYGFTRRWLKTSYLVAAMIVSGAMIVWCALFARGALHVTSLDAGSVYGYFWFGCLRVTYSFAAGIIAYRRVREMAGQPSRAKAMLVTCFVLFCGFGLLLAYPSSGMRVPYELAAVLFGFPLLIVVGARYDRGSNIPGLSLLGRISFPLYIIHTPVGHLADAICRAHGILVEEYAPWSGALLLLVLLPLCWCLETYVDVPLRRAFAVRFGFTDGTSKSQVLCSHSGAVDPCRAGAL